MISASKYWEIKFLQIHTSFDTFMICARRTRSSFLDIFKPSAQSITKRSQWSIKNTALFYHEPDYYHSWATCAWKTSNRKWVIWLWPSRRSTEVIGHVEGCPRVSLRLSPQIQVSPECKGLIRVGCWSPIQPNRYCPIDFSGAVRFVRNCCSAGKGKQKRE